MKINRTGSSADHGERFIDIDKPTVKWNQNKKIVQFSQSRIRDFSTDSKHDYTIDISLSEIREILQVIGNEPVTTEPEIISKELSLCLREIIRIEKACVGNIG